MFFRISLKTFTLILLLNISYTIFVVCNIGHPCLPCSDVTLIKNKGKSNFTNKRYNEQFSKFFLKDKISYNSLLRFLIYVKSSSTIDHSTLLMYSLRGGFERFTGKKFDLYLHIYKRFVEVTKMQWFSCILERLI